MEKTYTVYKHTTPSAKVYIGITKNRPTKRWGNGKYYKNNKFFYKAIKKYGWENIKHEILEKELSYEEAIEKEKEYIQTYKSLDKNNGYNLIPGGIILNDEIINKMRDNAAKKKIVVAVDYYNHAYLFDKESVNKIIFYPSVKLASEDFKVGTNTISIKLNSDYSDRKKLKRQYSFYTLEEFCKKHYFDYYFLKNLKSVKFYKFKDVAFCRTIFDTIISWENCLDKQLKDFDSWR